MAARSTNTMIEGLQRLLSDIAQMKSLADSDLPFLVELETMVLGKLRAPVQQMSDQGMMPQGPPAAPPGMEGGMGPSFQGAGLPGVATQPAAPNADELSRLLNSGQ